MRSKRPDLRSEKPDLGSERSDLESKRPDLGSERLYLRLGGGGRTDGWKDGQTDRNWRKLPYMES